MTNLEGVYWDLDGTIANTELEAHLPAFNYAFNDFNLNWNWDINTYIELLKINGGKNRISYYSKLINKFIDNEEVKRIHERKQYHYINYVRKNNVISLKTGVYRLIKELKKKEVRQFIVTSSSKRQASLITNQLFKEFNPFEFIISSDDVKFHKPHPMPYLKAMKISGIEFNKSIVFEDSSPGLRSSLAARLPTIFVPSNIPAVIDSDIDLNCFIDSLGNESCKSNVIKGPKLDSNYVDCAYLEKYLLTF
ncbi:Putative CbbY-like protein [Prochlorococcus marinus str. MIT 9515]|uniref:Putative CbbY-like protein n=1 Tax=Prochlorococcus marinus (strain MIT 9515) TaxID=167542 RepID=A2BWH4_PROM5|nr:HAD-IA family hydrolase [Prochlorococcus marinus]ABM72135.1 Putative CbbY-like protein [Prochlorococcus marinus str. MIT 9515]